MMRNACPPATTDKEQSLKQAYNKFYLFHNPFAIAIFLGGLGIALFAPVDVIDRFPWIRAISTPLGEIFPPISGYTKRSYFPQVTELYFTVMWILSPLSFYWMWQNLPFEKEISVRFGFRYAFYALLALVIVIPVSMATFWYFNHGYEFIWMPMSSSRWALGTWGYVLAGVGGWWALVWEIKLTRKVISDVKFTWNERGK